MCRLFFSLTKSSQNNEPKRLLLNFFDKCEQEDINDGFGICWYNQHSWHTYKKPLHYRDDPHIFRKVDNISSKVIIAHARNINKEEVSKYHILKERCVENTHPILYNGYLFMHHGDLLIESEKGLLGHQRFKRLPEFRIKIKELRTHIDAELLKDMKGNTDSELLLFLFLSIQKQSSEEKSGKDSELNKKLTTEEIMLKSFLEMINLIEKNDLVNKSNIVLAVNGYVLIAKILKNNSKFKKTNELPLYVDAKNKGEIIASTIKLSQNAENLKNNTIILINHKKNIINTYKI
jgi:predicted glutamine amidotransferase